MDAHEVSWFVVKVTLFIDEKATLESSSFSFQNCLSFHYSQIAICQYFVDLNLLCVFEPKFI